jgi:cytochrome P450
LLATHIGLLVSKLNEHAEQGLPIDMSKYFEFTTSDIIGDFCYADSFGQLRSGEQDSFIGGMHKYIPFTVRLHPLLNLLTRGALSGLLPLLVKVLHKIGVDPKKMMNKIDERVKRRIDMGTDQKDMMTHVIEHISENGDGISTEELAQTSLVLMLAGSETTATTLAGSLFYLLKNRDVLNILLKEIRTAFTSDKDITILKV